MQRMGGGVAVIPAAPAVLKSADLEYPYRQNSDFYYLTGFSEPGALAVLSPEADKPFVLFVQPRDREKEVWTGQRVGVEGAVADYGADAAFTNQQVETELPKLIAAAEKLYYSIGSNEQLNRQLIRFFTAGRDARIRSGHGPTEIIDPSEILHALRLVKDAREVELIRQAVEITSAAHRRAIELVTPGRHEYELEAAIDFVFRSQGATGPAYPTIVASGPNAATLHHRTGGRVIQAGELVLIDAGAEYEYYCADVSRTLPASGSFSARQRELYELVLLAQKRAIAKIKPGVSWEAPHQAAVRTLAEGLLALGLLRGDLEEIVTKEHYSGFYMHRTSHWLGIDVHDAGRYKKGSEPTLLQPGMVLTIEPGLYIAAERSDIAEHWRGIGIRIEDDALVTEDGCEILTAGIPKEIAEVEAMTRSDAKVS